MLSELKWQTARISILEVRVRIPLSVLISILN
nr:MAG TPA: hypothetical protein [Caudoviricetes sp.]